MDDKGCPLEPSERVREMAKEALEACCPNVGPPPLEEGVETVPPVTPPPPETPPAPGPETPPTPPPELPPPPGRNGVEPGLIPPPAGEVTPRPTLQGDTSMRHLLRSRADRMAATSQVRRAPAVRRATVPHSHARAPVAQPLVAAPRVQLPVAQPPATRLVISDEIPIEPSPASGATVTLSDTGALPALSERENNENTLRIRISDPEGSERRASAAPAVMPLTSRSAASPSSASGGGTTVRIRDSGDDLQLASAEDEPAVETKTTSVVSSRRSQAPVSELFAPPAAVATPSNHRSVRPASTQEHPSEVVNSVQSAQPRGASRKVQGHVSNIDSRAGTVRFRVNAGQSPAAGTLVKVYHQFLLGEECVGALEVIDVQKGIATARPVGNVSLAKLSPGDHVAY
jgi:hypothetical protein